MRPALRLVLVSLLALFHEMVVVRWLAGECRVYGYYANLPLITAFFGIGVGCILAPRSVRLLPLFAPLLLAFVFLATTDFFKRISLTAWTGEQLNPQFFADRGGALVAFHASFLFLLLLSGATFVPLGQEMGRAFRPFRPLAGYSLNLLGSLIGIWGFALSSFVCTSAIPWFVVTAVGVVLLETGRTRAVTLVCAAAAVLLAAGADRDEIWSRYYRIQVSDYHLPDDTGAERKVGTFLCVNNDYYQRMLDLREPFASQFPVLRQALAYYDRPYRHVSPRSVLVVGAGTGNDVAAALRNDVQRIDAVEIDPEILSLGRRMHPEKPYSDRRAHPYVDDARSFLRRSREKYDLIVFGLLDSHALVSGIGRLRLDNYVYTLECLTEARDHLAPGGAVYIAFTAYAPWIYARFYGMFHEVFGDDFITGHEDYDAAGLFAGGVGVRSWRAADGKTWNDLHLKDEEIPELPTDDWPFLYKEDRTFPREYAVMLGLLLVAFAVAGRASLAKGAGWHGQMAALGAAFLLLEVRGVASLALLLGSTWLVIAIVITVILVLALAANAIASVWQRPPIPLLYALVCAAAVLCYLVPTSSLLDLGYAARVVAGGALVALPFFFASILFSTAFREAKDVEGALGSNLLGAVAGGLSEYASMMTGIRALALLAVVYYMIGFLVQQRRAR